MAVMHPFDQGKEEQANNFVLSMSEVESKLSFFFSSLLSLSHHIEKI